MKQLELSIYEAFLHHIALSTSEESQVYQWVQNMAGIGVIARDIPLNTS